MDRPIPNAISFRQLEQWRQQARNPEAESTQPAHLASQAQLEQLLSQYERLSQELIQELGLQSETLRQQRSGAQLMALGALGAHLRLGLQALAASRR